MRTCLLYISEWLPRFTNTFSSSTAFSSLLDCSFSSFASASFKSCKIMCPRLATSLYWLYIIRSMRYYSSFSASIASAFPEHACWLDVSLSRYASCLLKQHFCADDFEKCSIFWKHLQEGTISHLYICVQRSTSLYLLFVKSECMETLNSKRHPRK